MKSGELRLKKVNGVDNSADLMTKAVNGEVLDGHLKRMGFEPRGGRADKASELNTMNKSKEDEDIKGERKIKAAEKEVVIVSPHCVRVHDIHGKLMKGRRWVT